MLLCKELRDYDAYDPMFLRTSVRVDHILPLERCMVSFLSDLTEETCECILDVFKWCRVVPQFSVMQVLKMADNLPVEHPGWKVLANITSRFKFTKEFTYSFPNHEDVAVGILMRLRDRLVHGDFPRGIQPYACGVWVICRLHIYTPPNDALEFPPEWKHTMKSTISGMDGMIDMLFSTKCTVRVNE